MGALYEGKIVSNNVKRRHLNSGQRAMAVAMMYPEARHGGSRQAGSSSATELDISKDRLSMAAPCCALEAAICALRLNRVPGPHQVYGFLTTAPNAVVEPIHPKASR
jgi:hypothetical protein